jgi:hypothetical protein
MRNLLTSVEWSPHVARIHSQLSRVSVTAHFILPNLPDVYDDDLQKQFYANVPPRQRIQTIAACLHTAETLTELLVQSRNNVDKILIVGGNAKQNHPKPGLSTLQALRVAKGVEDISNAVELWGVANPNDIHSKDEVHAKLEAGMSGIITQPLLLSHATETLASYPRDGDTNTIVYMAGLALPKTAKGLLFWLDLLGQSDLADDALFRDHCEYFSAGKDSLTWAQDQLTGLDGATNVDGIHYMPMRNTRDLVSLLSDTDQW